MMKKMKMMKKMIVILCTVVFFMNVIHVQAFSSNGYMVKKKGEKATYVENVSKRALSANSDIEYIEPNYEATLFASPTDPKYYQQWNLDLIKAQSAWDLGCYGNDVKIGVIDSGIYMHSDIVGNVLPGYNYNSNNTNTTDSLGHGTFVSGLIAANWNDIGIAGIAKNAKIVPIKCFDGEKTTVDILCKGIYDAVDKYDCKIINMSFGLTSNSRALKDAVDYAYSKGAILVAAVGNEGNSTINYPAGWDNVIGVGSVNVNEFVASTSNKNRSVMLTAPGEAVQSLSLRDGLRFDSGTSFSTPTVAGAIAIALCVDGTLTQDDFINMMPNICDDKGDVGYDIKFGHGILNIGKMMEFVLKDKSYFVSPTSEDKGETEITVYNNTEQSITGEAVFASYYNKTLTDIKIINQQIPGKVAQTFNYASPGDEVNFMFWDLKTLCPFVNKVYVSK
ncbi:MAG: S8 family serine peptidase [Christensenella sp.]